MAVDTAFNSKPKSKESAVQALDLEETRSSRRVWGLGCCCGYEVVDTDTLEGKLHTRLQTVGDEMLASVPAFSHRTGRPLRREELGRTARLALSLAPALADLGSRVTGFVAMGCITGSVLEIFKAFAFAFAAVLSETFSPSRHKAVSVPHRISPPCCAGVGLVAVSAVIAGSSGSGSEGNGGGGGEGEEDTMKPNVALGLAFARL
eukprot:408216-Rhodomonas_salina.3